MRKETENMRAWYNSARFVCHFDDGFYENFSTCVMSLVFVQANFLPRTRLFFQPSQHITERINELERRRANDSLPPRRDRTPGINARISLLHCWREHEWKSPLRLKGCIIFQRFGCSKAEQCLGPRRRLVAWFIPSRSTKLSKIINIRKACSLALLHHHQEEAKSDGEEREKVENKRRVLKLQQRPSLVEEQINKMYS